MSRELLVAGLGVAPVGVRAERSGVRVSSGVCAGKVRGCDDVLLKVASMNERMSSGCQYSLLAN
jgi:hypothetical protein